MRPSALPQPLLWLLLAGSSSWAQVIDNLSFGHKGNLSPNGEQIPGWLLSSTNHKPQILSDRLILTPPYPGNTRGALWSNDPVTTDTWTAELEFRTLGQDGGSGNLQLWYAKDKSKISANSVHTVGNFDGLALLVDPWGKGGSIRGFLNDGDQNYKAHNGIESLAFANCPYSYRNLGRPSKLKISNNDGLTVSIDDRECFRSEKITLPKGYYFGITSAAPDIPDSFEVRKFTVIPGGAAPKPPRHQHDSRQEEVPQLQKLDRLPGSPEAVPDRAATEIKSQEEQFADLHNRLQGLTHQVANMFGEFEALASKIDERNKQVLDAMPSSLPSDAIAGLTRKLENVELVVEAIRRDVEGKDYRETLNQLNRAVESVRGGITEGLPDKISGIMSQSAPRMGNFVLVIVAVQIMLAGAYVMYKRRRNSMPKKYL